MPSFVARFTTLVGILSITAPLLPAQSPSAPPVLSRIEPGLESAVKWKWWPAPSVLPPWGTAAPEPAPTPNTEPTPDPNRPRETYIVAKGDALILIAKKYGLSVLQLKTFNALPNDTIRVGQVLNIPNRQEALAIGPFPEIEKKSVPGKTKSDRKADNQLRTQLANLPVQVLLDRQQFSTGPIDGVPGLTFERVKQLYLSVHPDLAAPGALEAAARENVRDGLASYTLKESDFRFIAPPKAARLETAATDPAGVKEAKASASALRYEELVATPFLAYKTPWEFVAERFHCSEAFLRDLNPQITTVPSVGTEFRVPSVVPFAIEKSLIEPLQPTPDPRSPITAAILDLSLLTISQNGTIIAVMPLSVARPGLRGKGTWTILNAIPRPRLATLQEPTAPPKAVPHLYGSESQTVAPVKPILEKEQYLAAGPNNPAGIIWINLAKTDSTEPLPYGLTGTSIPDQMNTQESIGGLRLTNWDIARAVRHLPIGTALEWGQNVASPAAAAPTVLPALPASSGDAPLFQAPTSPAQ